tara:strand:+ start:1903 stop:2154 length:252 start_codon:yes stop_codon:yes gene_type:complete
MQITLTRDINEKKGLIKGAILNWPKTTITGMTESLVANGTLATKDEEWYKQSESLMRSLRRQDVDRGSKRRVGRPRKEEAVEV